MFRSTPENPRIAAWSAILLGSATTLVAAGVPLFHAATDRGPASLPVGVQLGALLACVTALINYSYQRHERSYDRLVELLERPAPGTLVYRNTASFLEALAIATVGASEVCTVNSAVPRGVLPELDAYFRKVHKYLNSKDAVGSTFRSVAYVETFEKARWLVQRAAENAKTPVASFAVVRQRSLGESATLCFHIVRKGTSYMSFLYPSPDVSGSMQGVAIVGRETFDVLYQLFERIWARGALLSSGSTLHSDGFEQLALLCPSLRESAEFQNALRLCVD